MVSIGELRQALALAQDSLPFAAAEDYREQFEAISQQTAAVLRTSKDEQAILATIDEARHRGGEAITMNLARIREVIESASSTW